MKLAQRPLLTQSITTAVSTYRPCQFNHLFSGDCVYSYALLQVLFATGDVMAQQAVERVGLDRHNFARTGRMALYGGGASTSNYNTLSMETLN